MKAIGLGNRELRVSPRLVGPDFLSGNPEFYQCIVNTVLSCQLWTNYRPVLNYSTDLKSGGRFYLYLDSAIKYIDTVQYHLLIKGL